MSGRPRVLLTRAWPPEAERRIAARVDLVTTPPEVALGRADLVGALRAFDVVCPTITDRIDRALLAEAGSLRTQALCNFGAGVDHIDVAACRAAGLAVTNTPGVLTDDTADLAILLALMCVRRAGEGERLARRGDWTGWTPTQLLGSRLSGKTLGLIGFGRIGQAVAHRARHGFGMNIIYHARTPAREGPDARHLPFDEVMATADIVSLHCPGGEETRNLVDEAALARMKPGAVLINTARGGIVDEQALWVALKSGRLAAAGLDVHQNEPAILPELLALENVVLLPHLGSATLEARTAMGMCAADNLFAILDGRPPPNGLE